MTLWTDRLTFEVSSADPDSSSPVWVDLTSRVRGLQQVQLSTGRQNDLERAEPSQLTLMLNNFDDALTFGNTSSPYTSWWGPGRKCRLREIIGSQTLDRFVGFIEQPTETVLYAGEQWVQISAVDRLARLDRTPVSVSTLSANIVGAGGSSLKAFYPMAEAVGTTAYNFAPYTRLPMTAITTTVGTGVPVNFDDMFTLGTGDAPGADDATTATLTPQLDVTGFAVKTMYPRVDWSTTIDQASGETVALVCWVKFNNVTAVNQSLVPCLLGATGGYQLVLQRTGGTWTADFGAGIPVATLSPTGPVHDKWCLVALRMTLPSGLVEFWQDDDPPLTGTLSGSPPSSATWQYCYVGNQIDCQIGRVQVYVGTGAYTNQMHMDQFEAGVNAFSRQTTGERIKTLARYAGLSDADLTQVDTGCSVMRAASLAGKSTLSAMREAETTEQGLLYIDNSGNLTFADRRTLYNI